MGSTIRSHRRKGRFCAEKTPFLSAEDAQAAHGLHVPYLCPACGSWHLTSETTPSTRPRRSARDKKRGKAARGWK